MLLALAAVPTVMILTRAGATPASDHPGHRVLVVLAGARRVTIDLAPLVQGGRLRGAALSRAIARGLPSGATAVRGAARISYRYDLAATVSRARAAGLGGGTVLAVRHPVSSRIAVPVVGQRLRNDCEATALQIALSAEGVRVSQSRLQRELPSSGPLDPNDGPNGRVWGDPDRGFVGRPDGGGTAGGFGVYPGPVGRLAARHGVSMQSLTGVSPQRLYARVLTGTPVIAWVGLSDGPYGRWTTPDGRAIRVNFGEHTVVLAGVYSDGSLRVVNPLRGTLERWSRSQFEQMWRRLGRRALAAA